MTSISTVNTRKERIQGLMAQMGNGLLEREHQIKLIMLAALSGEHVLLVGPPGTAKSELAKRLKSIFVEANYFERLVTRFSVPEELFGPLSIKALEEDRYNRLTSGYLPEASVAFIDEIFKANSAILNSLLTLLNERQFDNGNSRHQVPLISVIAASNELPKGEELSALYDRFILRSYVPPVSDVSFDDLLDLQVEGCDPELSQRLKIAELDEVQSLADKVQLTTAVKALCGEFRHYLKVEDIQVSDRRWRKLVKLMKVSAFTSGFNETSIYDAWILPHCLWEDPEQFEGLQDLYQRLVTVDGKTYPSRLLTVLKTWEKKLLEEQRTHKLDAKGRLLYLDREGKETTDKTNQYQKRSSHGDLIYWDDHYKRETTDKLKYHGRGNNEPVFEDVEHSPIALDRTFSRAHIKSRVMDIQNIISDIEIRHKNVNNELLTVKGYFDSHLWLNKALLPDILHALESSLKAADKLLTRAHKLEKGFSHLPQEVDPLLEFDDDEEFEEIEGELCD